MNKTAHMAFCHIIKSLACFLVLITATGNTQAQSKQQQTEKLFAGLWVHKQTTRYLEISFYDGYAIVTDWTSKFQKRESGDIYKAILKNGKLVMPEDTQHHAPYSEILFRNNTLIYLTKPMAPGTTTKWDKQVFTRSHSKIQ